MLQSRYIAIFLWPPNLRIWRDRSPGTEGKRARSWHRTVPHLLKLAAHSPHAQYPLTFCSELGPASASVSSVQPSYISRAPGLQFFPSGPPSIPNMQVCKHLCNLIVEFKLMCIVLPAWPTYQREPSLGTPAAAAAGSLAPRRNAGPVRGPEACLMCALIVYSSSSSKFVRLVTRQAAVHASRCGHMYSTHAGGSTATHRKHRTRLEQLLSRTENQIASDCVGRGESRSHEFACCTLLTRRLDCFARRCELNMPFQTYLDVMRARSLSARDAPYIVRHKICSSDMFFKNRCWEPVLCTVSG
jgi:hypothetical protein